MAGQLRCGCERLPREIESASIIIVSSVSGFEVDFAAGSYGASAKAAPIHYAKGPSSQLIAKGMSTKKSLGNTYFEWRSNIEQGMLRSVQDSDVLEPDRADGHLAGEVAVASSFLASPVASRISCTNLITSYGALTKHVQLAKQLGKSWLVGTPTRRDISAKGHCFDWTFALIPRR